MRSLILFFKKNIDVMVIFLIVFSIKLFVVDVKRVDGLSMYPTLNNKVESDRVILNRINHYTNSYNRGDVVIIKKNDGSGDSIIKRVIGIEGDLVEIKNGYVFLNGEKLEEDYIREQGVTWPEGRFQVQSDSVFVLGDNRLQSSDSRMYGTFKHEDIQGEAIMRFNILKFDGNGL